MSGYFTPTRSWDETEPSGDELGATIDELMVYIKVDIRQRLEAGHWFDENQLPAEPEAYEWVGAHKRGFVQSCMYHVTRTALKSWAVDNYGATGDDWNKYSGCMHLVWGDATASKNGIYRVTGTASIVKIADKPSVSSSVEPD